MDFTNIFKDYFTFLQFKTISSNPIFKEEMEKCAIWLCNYLQKGGLESEVITTSSYPVVFAKTPKVEGAPTFLFYGHYDVQDIDPLEEWKSDPFDPVVRDGCVYARGAADNKGQVFYFINAIINWLRLGKNNLNIKICIEGEEESGSCGLENSLPLLKEKLFCDYLLVVDCDMLKEDRPAITLGLRGILPFEIELRGIGQDLHSGHHGGMAYNPAKALVMLLAKLWDKKGRVAIPHFYDDMEKVSRGELRHYCMEFNQDEYKQNFGIKALEEGACKNPLYACWFEPTLEINGIRSGYIKSGMKTIIPSIALAKLSCRLVPHQKIEKIKEDIERFFNKILLPGMEMKINFYGGGEAIRTKTSSFLIESIIHSYSEVFGRKCERIMMGGSVPIVLSMYKVLGCEVAMLGTSILSDNIHSPNEHFSLDRFKKGYFVILKLLTDFRSS